MHSATPWKFKSLRVMHACAVLACAECEGLWSGSSNDEFALLLERMAYSFESLELVAQVLEKWNWFGLNVGLSCSIEALLLDSSEC